MDRPSSHSQRGPYSRKEGRKSLLSKVKDSVKDMLSPSWLSDLVSSVKKDPPTDSQEIGQQQMYMSPVSTPQGIPQSGIPQQMPPSNPMPFQAQGMPLGNGQPRMMDFANRAPAGLAQGEQMSPFQQPMIPPPVSEFTSSQLPLARLTEKSDSVLAHDDSVSQRSDGSKSTSGCSSMIPQADARRRETALEKRKASDHELFSAGTSQASPGDQPSKRQRLQVSVNSSKTWTRGLGDSFSQQQASAAVNRPSFNTSLFGSPLADESSLLGSSFHESSFYPGKTTFGGRSSLSFRAKRNKTDLNQSLPSRLSIPVKSFMKAKPKANQTKVAVTSSTAKRILEALDKMPTPLNDAKRIPLSVPRHWTESPSFFSRDKPSPASGPPTEKLNVSSLATISQNRQVSFSPVKRIPQPSTSKNEARPMPLPSRDETIILGGPGAPSGKMRRDKSYHRGSAAISNRPALEEEDTEILPPNLTTDFTLPVSSMPKFSFAAAPARSAAPASTPNKPALNFTFSSPIAENVPVNKPKSPETQGGFQFSSPISVDKQQATSSNSEKSKPFSQMPASPVASKASSNQPKVPVAFGGFSSPANKSSNMEYTFSSSAAPKPKAKINGPSTNIDSGMQPASELKQGSVMDILGGGSPMTSKSAFGGVSPASELKQGSVMDILGGGKPLTAGSGSILNGPSSSSPLFGKKQDTDIQSVDTASKQPFSSASATSSLPPLSSVFSSSGWNCDVCLVKNKADSDKCVACQSNKPLTAQQKTDKTPASLPAPLSTLFSSAGWTCSVCLVKNKADLSKCLACQTPKPAGSGSQGKCDTGKSAPPLSALVKTSAGWTCDVCLVKNKTDDIKCVACQSAKPGGASSGSAVSKGSGHNDLLAKFKTPAGQWECEVCLVRNKPELTMCVACQTPKPLKSFKHPPGDWTCDTCLVANKQTSVKCVACNYQRPGPPRTQAVPSCVKTFSQSQNSGFGALSDTNKKLDVNTSGGGFKIGGDSKADSSAGGFKFGSSSTSDSSSVSTSATGGFKFGAAPSAIEDKTSTSSAGGFKFGSAAATTGAGGISFGASSDSKSQPSTGGFKFGSSVPSVVSSSEQKSGLSQGTVAPQPAGFSFGAPVTASTNSVSSDKNKVGSSTSTLSGGMPGGFSFGQTVKAGDPPQATTSVPGGFTFKPSDSLVSSKSNGSATEQTSSIGGTQTIGGFNFSASNKSETSSTNVQTSSVTSNSVGGFSFTASKSTENNLAAGTPASQSTEKKAGFGGFTFGSSASTNTSQPAAGFGGFNFAQKPADSLAGQTSSKPTSLKRDRDEDSEATGAKKSFTFGANSGSSSATPFQFGAASSTPATTVANTSVSSTPFAFGQSTGSGSTFNFSAGKADAAPTPVFGAASTTAQSGTTAPAFGSGMTFNFTGQKTEAPSTGTSAPVFAFGAQSAQQPSTGTTPAFGGFGSTSSTFGTSSTSAFGGIAPSSTPAFGAKPPAFGATSTNTAAAPAFGVCVSSCLKDDVKKIVSEINGSADEEPVITKNPTLSKDTLTAKTVNNDINTRCLFKYSQQNRIDETIDSKNSENRKLINKSNKLQQVINDHVDDSLPLLKDKFDETNPGIKSTLNKPVKCNNLDSIQPSFSSTSIEHIPDKDKEYAMELSQKCEKVRQVEIKDFENSLASLKEFNSNIIANGSRSFVIKENNKQDLDLVTENKDYRIPTLKDASMQTDCVKSTQTSNTDIQQSGNDRKSEIQDLLENVKGRCIAFILPKENEEELSDKNVLKLLNIQEETIQSSCEKNIINEVDKKRERPVMRLIMSSVANGPCVSSSPPVSGLVQTVGFPLYSTRICTSTLSAGSTATGINPAKLVSVTWTSGTAMSATQGTNMTKLPLEMYPINHNPVYNFMPSPIYNNQYTGMSQYPNIGCNKGQNAFENHRHLGAYCNQPSNSPQYRMLGQSQSTSYKQPGVLMNPFEPNSGKHISQPPMAPTFQFKSFNQLPSTSKLTNAVNFSPFSFEQKQNTNNVLFQSPTVAKLSSREALLQHKRNNKNTSNLFEPNKNLDILSQGSTLHPFQAAKIPEPVDSRINPVSSLGMFKPFCQTSSKGVSCTVNAPLFVFGQSSDARTAVSNFVATTFGATVGKTGTKLNSSGFVFQPQTNFKASVSVSNTRSDTIMKASLSPAISISTASISMSAPSAPFQFSMPFVSQPTVCKGPIGNTSTCNNMMECNDIIMGECEETKKQENIKQTTSNSVNLFQFSQPIQQKKTGMTLLQGKKVGSADKFLWHFNTEHTSSFTQEPQKQTPASNLNHQTDEMVCAFGSTRVDAQKILASDSDSSNLPQETWSKSLVFGGTKDFCSMEGQEDSTCTNKGDENRASSSFPCFLGARDFKGKPDRCVSVDDHTDMECKFSPPKKLKSPLAWLNLTSTGNDEKMGSQITSQNKTAIHGATVTLQNKSVLKLISNAAKSVETAVEDAKPTVSNYVDQGSASNVFVFSGKKDNSKDTAPKPMVPSKRPNVFVFNGKQDSPQKTAFNPMPSCSKNTSDVSVFKGNTENFLKSTLTFKPSNTSQTSSHASKRSSEKHVFSGKPTIFSGKGTVFSITGNSSKSACESSSKSSLSSSSSESSTSDSSSSSSSDSHHSLDQSCSEFDQMEEDIKPRDDSNNNSLSIHESQKTLPKSTKLHGLYAKNCLILNERRYCRKRDDKDDKAYIRHVFCKHTVEKFMDVSMKFKKECTSCVYNYARCAHLEVLWGECLEEDCHCVISHCVDSSSCVCASILSLSVFSPDHKSSTGTGGFSSTPAAPAQSNAVFQFGAKPQEASQPGSGFNFNPAGLGSQPSFNFGASSTPGTMAFSATPTATPQTSERKIKKAIRKVRR